MVEVLEQKEETPVELELKYVNTNGEILITSNQALEIPKEVETGYTLGEDNKNVDFLSSVLLVDVIQKDRQVGKALKFTVYILSWDTMQVIL